MVKVFSRFSTVYGFGRAMIALSAPQYGSAITLCGPSTAPTRFSPSRKVVSEKFPFWSISPTAFRLSSDSDLNSIRPPVTVLPPAQTTLPVTGYVLGIFDPHPHALPVQATMSTRANTRKSDDSRRSANMAALSEDPKACGRFKGHCTASGRPEAAPRGVFNPPPLRPPGGFAAGRPGRTHPESPVTPPE